MGSYRISFEADPLNSKSGWGGRKTSQVKMILSLTEYLAERCGASNIRIFEVKEEAAAPAVEKPKKRTKAGGIFQ